MPGGKKVSLRNYWLKSFGATGQGNSLKHSKYFHVLVNWLHNFLIVLIFLLFPIVGWLVDVEWRRHSAKHNVALRLGVKWCSRCTSVSIKVYLLLLQVQPA